MKKRIIIICCVMFALGLSAYFFLPKGTVSTSTATYPTLTEEELVNDNDLIIKATVEKILDSEYANPGFKLGEDIPNVIVTDVLARAETVYKGDVSPGDLITIRKEGGKVGKEEYINEDMPNFQVGNEVLLFLSYPRAGEKNEISTTDYYVFNPVQGVYFPEDDTDKNIYKAYGTDETLNPSTLQEEIHSLLKAENTSQ